MSNHFQTDEVNLPVKRFNAPITPTCRCLAAQLVRQPPKPLRGRHPHWETLPSIHPNAQSRVSPSLSAKDPNPTAQVARSTAPILAPSLLLLPVLTPLRPPPPPTLPPKIPAAQALSPAHATPRGIVALPRQRGGHCERSSPPIARPRRAGGRSLEPRDDSGQRSSSSSSSSSAVRQGPAVSRFASAATAAAGSANEKRRGSVALGWGV
jgi:hypothetical protein